MRENGSSSDEKLKWEYEEVSQNFRALADIRFKLLALIPPLGGVAIYLLSSLAKQSEPEAQLLLALISCLGFLATLGLTSYDQRNSELYDALIGRAKFLERALKLTPNPNAKVASVGFRGQFLERPPRGKKLFGFLTLGHDSGLALIYGSVLGAWFFPLIATLLAGLGYASPSRFTIGLCLASVMIFTFILALLLLDPARRRPTSTGEEHRDTSEGGESAANPAERTSEAAAHRHQR
jgi:hypothetical protein